MLWIVWIDGREGVVTSTLRQKLKYPAKGNIITVCGEEEYMVSHFNSFKYVEMDVEFFETSCKNFEVIPQTTPIDKVAPIVPKVTRIPPKMASLKDAKAVVEEDGCTIWGQLPDIPYKSDKIGLGFTSGAKKAVRRARARGPPLCISNHGVNVVEDTNSDCDLDNWVFPTTSGGFNNWTARDFVSISFIQE